MDKKEALKQIKAGNFTLADANKKLKADKDVVLAAVKQDADAFIFADKKLKADKKIVMAKTKAEIKKFKKLEQVAHNNTDESGHYVDEFDYCLGRFAEDLCSAGYKEWAKKIYKIVEEKLYRCQIDSCIYLNLAEDIVAYLGDKKWARKIYKEAEGSVDGMFLSNEELADSIIKTLGDKEWAKKIQES